MPGKQSVVFKYSCSQTGCPKIRLIAPTNGIHSSMNTLYMTSCKTHKCCEQARSHWLRFLVLFSSNFWTTLFMRSTRFYMSIAYECRNFWEFGGFAPICESFPCVFCGVGSFGGTSVQSAEVFSMKIFFPPI